MQSLSDLLIAVNPHLVCSHKHLDPLVNPDSCSTNVHSVFGSVDSVMTISRENLHDPNWQDNMGNANQTTSHIVPNQSMYWAPIQVRF
jgi:hypothetical protein